MDPWLRHYNRSTFFVSLVIAGGGGGLLVNTVRRDSERAKRILGYAAVTGMPI